MRRFDPVDPGILQRPRILLWRRLRWIVVLYSLVSPPLSAATLYVSNVARGSNTCRSAANACQFSTAVNQVRPLARCGDTVLAEPGVYSGDDNRLIPSAGFECPDSAPLTIRSAVYDPDDPTTWNTVQIDNEGSRVGILIGSSSPPRKRSNITLLGIGARGRYDGGDFPTLGVQDSVRITIKGGVFADVGMTWNRHVCAFKNATEVLFEDNACIGTGRKALEHYASWGPIVVRRVIGEFCGSMQQGPKMVFAPIYQSRNSTFENVFARYDERCMTAAFGVSDPYLLVRNNRPFSPPRWLSGRATDQAYGAYGADRIDFAEIGERTNRNRDADTATYGSFFYMKRGDRKSGTGSGTLPGVLNYVALDAIGLKDIVIYVAASPPDIPLLTHGLWLKNCSVRRGPVCSGALKWADSIAVINESGKPLTNEIDSQWRTEGGTGPPKNIAIGPRASIYTSGDSLFSASPGHGGKICTRIVNGVDTGEPLFPLPISSVLQDYMTRVLHRTPINVEADIEEAAGVPIPAPCRNASPSGGPAKPAGNVSPGPGRPTGSVSSASATMSNKGKN